MADIGHTVVRTPNDLEIVATRDYEAPIELVFEVITLPEHIRQTMAPFDEQVTECSVDLRPGGSYRNVFVTPDGLECAFKGEYLEIDPPHRVVATWEFEGWPGVEAVESDELAQSGDVTTLTWRLAFRDRAGREHWKSHDGIESNLEQLDNYLRSLLSAR